MPGIQEAYKCIKPVMPRANIAIFAYDQRTKTFPMKELGRDFAKDDPLPGKTGCLSTNIGDSGNPYWWENVEKSTEKGKDVEIQRSILIAIHNHGIGHKGRARGCIFLKPIHQCRSRGTGISYEILRWIKEKTGNFNK